MVKFNNTTLAVTLFFCVISGLLFWQFVHKYIQQKTLQLDLERQKLFQINTNILNYKSKYGNLDEYMQSLEERFQLSNKTLPERMEQDEFINFLQKTALENQIKIVSLTPSTIQPVYDDSQNEADAENSTETAKNLNENLIKLPIKIKIEGSYISLMKFLEAMESKERLINIEELSITSKDDGEQLNCALSIIIFALKSKNISE